MFIVSRKRVKLLTLVEFTEEGLMRTRKSGRVLNMLTIGLLIFLPFVMITLPQAIAMPETPTSLVIQRVIPTPGSISFSYPLNSFRRDFLLAVSGSLKTDLTMLPAPGMNSLVFTFTVLKQNQIVQTIQSQVILTDSANSLYWTTNLWITVPLPDAYAGFSLVAYFAGSGNLSPSTAQTFLFLELNTPLETVTSYTPPIVSGSLPRPTSIVVKTSAVVPYGSMFYVSIGGTFTANYSTSCGPQRFCGHQTEPDAPALPIGLTIHFTITDGKQVVTAFNIVTNGLLSWSTQFWLPKPLTNYYLIAIFNGVPGEFSPTFTQTLLQV